MERTSPRTEVGLGRLGQGQQGANHALNLGLVGRAAPAHCALYGLRRVGKAGDARHPGAQVLAQKGNPLEGTVGQVALGLLTSLVVELVDDRVELRVQPLGGGDRGLNELDRTDLAAPDQLGLRRGVECVQIV